MSWQERTRKIWKQVSDPKTLAWLWGLTIASVAASAVMPAMPGAAAQPKWALAAVWFFGALAVFMTGARASAWSWRRLRPVRLSIRLRGGDSASLELSPSVDMDCYGRGWLVGEATTREHSFKLAWDDSAAEVKKIRAQDTATIRIARVDLTDPRDPQLCIDTIGRHVLAVSLHESIHRDGRLLEALPWVEMRVVLRSRSHEDSWTHDFRFRLEKDWRFRIQDLTQ